MGTHPIFESDFDCLTACGDVDKEMSDSDNAASHPHWKRIFDKRLKFLIWSLIVALFISIGCNVLLYFMFYSCNLSTSAKDLKDNTAQVQPTVTHASTNRTFDAQVEHIKESMHAILGNSLRGFAPRLDANGTPRVLTAPFLLSTKNVMQTFSEMEVIGPRLSKGIDRLNDLEKRFNHDAQKRHTLQEIIEEDIQNGIQFDRGSSTRTIQWATSNINFIRAILSGFTSGNKDTAQIFRNAYDTTLALEENFAEDMVVRIMLRSVPPYDEVVAIFQNGDFAISSPQFQTALNQTLRQYVNVLSRLLRTMNRYYENHGLKKKSGLFG